MLHLYLYFKIAKQPLGSSSVCILGMGYDRSQESALFVYINTNDDS